MGESFSMNDKNEVSKLIKVGKTKEIITTLRGESTKEARGNFLSLFFAGHSAFHTGRYEETPTSISASIKQKTRERGGEE